MHHLWRSLAVLLLAACSLVLSPAPACACSCAVSTEADYLDRADLAFVGVATAVDEPFLAGGGGEVKVTFVVESVTKGTAVDRVTLRTSSDGASCGYPFEAGYRYAVFSHLGETGLCSGNRMLQAAPEVPIGKPFPFGLVTAGGAVLIAGLIAFALYRRLLRKLSA